MPRAIFPSGSNQISDAVDQYARLAGAGAGEDQHVPLLPIVGHDALLDRVSSGFRRWRARIPAWSSAGRFPCPGRAASGARKSTSFMIEIVHRQAQRVASWLSEAALGKFRHHMDLQDLPLVVKVEGREVGPGETASVPGVSRRRIVMAGRKTARPLLSRMTSCSCSHSKARSSSLTGFLTLAHQNQVGFDCLRSACRAVVSGQQIRTAAAGRQAGEEMIQQARRPLRAGSGPSLRSHCHGRCSFTRTVSASLLSAPKGCPPSPSSPRPS